jgi:dimethylglycine dehydrogenase
MKEQAKVVVIGGGVVGVSALYHLAKKGWGDDVVLLEKAELTSGSTWHAAGLLPLFNMSYSVGQVHKYSVNLYNQLEEETGQPVGFSRVGNLRLAMNDDRMDEYYQYAATARTIGVDVRFLTPAEIGNLWPLCNTDGLVGGIFHPEDGYIQPADLTQALAKGARARGQARAGGSSRRRRAALPATTSFRQPATTPARQVPWWASISRSYRSSTSIS